MAGNREEQVKVGSVVVVAAVLFLSALVFVGGVNLFRTKKVTYVTFFKFAGGLEPGSFVRFGGLKVGTVRTAEIDPADSTRVRVRLQVAAGTPVRVDSKTRISTLGFLGENYVEISPGTRDAPRVPPGGEIPALEIAQIADVFNNVNNVTVNANKLVSDLDGRIVVLADKADQFLSGLNVMTGPENRRHLAAALANIDGLLTESRPKLNETLTHVQAASRKLSPVLENVNTAAGRAGTMLGNVNGLVQENRAETHEVLVRLRDSLVELRQVLGEVGDLLVSNRENLDQTLENIRVSSQNLKQFTDTIKRRPFSLIRVKAPKDRLPPAGR